jgi:hypothetical protein
LRGGGDELSSALAEVDLTYNPVPKHAPNLNPNPNPTPTPTSCNPYRCVRTTTRSCRLPRRTSRTSRWTEIAPRSRRDRAEIAPRSRRDRAEIAPRSRRDAQSSRTRVPTRAPTHPHTPPRASHSHTPARHTPPPPPTPLRPCPLPARPARIVVLCARVGIWIRAGAGDGLGRPRPSHWTQWTLTGRGVAPC